MASIGLDLTTVVVDLPDNFRTAYHLIVRRQSPPPLLRMLVVNIPRGQSE